MDKKEKIPINRGDETLSFDYNSIHTTCKCGKSIVLKFNGQWYDNKCECGVNIRMNRDKTKTITEDQQTNK